MLEPPSKIMRRDSKIRVAIITKVSKTFSRKFKVGTSYVCGSYIMIIKILYRGLRSE